MARNNNSNNEEPSTAPEPGIWYDITLGRSFKPHSNHPSPKFCTLRYEFKPASIDKSQPGSLHKAKNNKVTVEYHNNQNGKRKVIFEGVSEDYKENDAVLFFDGETFCLEQLHRAVKRLRHVRLPGESASAMASATLVAPAVENYSPQLSKGTNQQCLNKVGAHQVQVEQIGIGDSENSELAEQKTLEHPSILPSSSDVPPELNDYEPEEHLDIVNDHDDGCGTTNRENDSAKGSRTCLNIDINLPHQVDTDEEIADVDISDDEAVKGPNAAEALRAQVNAEGMKQQASSSSSSSGTDSSSENGSGSGSGNRSESGSESGSSSSSDSGSSDSDSVTSI